MSEVPMDKAYYAEPFIILSPGQLEDLKNWYLTHGGPSDKDTVAEMVAVQVAADIFGVHPDDAGSDD